MVEKIYGARLAGFKKVIIPEGNCDNLIQGFPDMELITARGIPDLCSHFFSPSVLKSLFPTREG